MIEIEVDTRSPTPHYEQIRRQISGFVLTGSLPPGTQLPPIRQLAGHLGISNGSVARAYKELEREGTVTTNGKKGTTIAPQDEQAARDLASPDRTAVLSEAARKYAAIAHSLGYDLAAASAALQSAMTSPLTKTPS
ncbi:MAG: GntR family transcriptional regulator [Candidatus Saccharibacteria bacterium]|nr:GntR family transcriptional regulator [Microbacteriaceae bacterium]